jgi:hypothetical protein
MIPKLIIQTGQPKLPVLQQAAIVNVKLLHPEFAHRFYDDAMIEAFLTDYFPGYKAEYQSFPFRIQRYDFFRYLAVYQFGGFYLDTDVFLTRNLVPLLLSQCVFPFEELAVSRYFWKQFQMDWQIGNYAFGAEPAHPFLAAVIENCLRAKRDPAWVVPMMEGVPCLWRDNAYVLNTTGPGMLSRTLAENPQLRDHITVLFPDDVCNSTSWYQFGEYGVHNMAGSWRPGSNLVGRVLIRQWRAWNLRRVLAESQSRGKTRTLTSMRQVEAPKWLRNPPSNTSPYL